MLISRAEAAANFPAKVIGADQILRTATLGGARALKLEGQVGELREGLQADFAVVSLEGSHQLPLTIQKRRSSFHRLRAMLG